MKRRQPPPVTGDVDVPAELLLGPVVEVWADEPDAPPGALSAWLNHRDARDAFVAALGRSDGLPVGARQTGPPWSYQILTMNPPELARRLIAAGLPVSWRPRHVGRNWPMVLNVQR